MTHSETTRPRLVGMNHVALEVGDIEELAEKGMAPKDGPGK